MRHMEKKEVHLSIVAPGFISRCVLFSLCGMFLGAMVAFLFVGMWSTGPVLSLAGRPLQASPNPQSSPGIPGVPPPWEPVFPPRNTKAANAAILKAKREEAKRDAVTLVELAESLKNDLAQSNERVMPISYVKRAEKIEKLAKKIKNWAKSK